MEGCGNSKQAISHKQRSSSPLAASRSPLAKQETRRSGETESSAHPAVADFVGTTGNRMEQFTAVGRARNADRSSPFMNKQLDLSLGTNEAAGMFLAAAGHGSSKTEHPTQEQRKIEELAHLPAVVTVRSVSNSSTSGSEGQNEHSHGEGIASHTNSSNFEVLKPHQCKEVETQMQDFFSSQQTSSPERSQGITPSHPAARGAVATYATACDVAKTIPGEDARGPMRQSIVQNSAYFKFCSVQSTSLIAATEKQQIGDTKDCSEATPVEAEAHDNKVSSVQHINPFAVLDMSLADEVIHPSVSPSVQPPFATTKKAKSPMRKLLSPSANNCKSRERRSKKHWERELANLKSSTTPAADGNLNKRRRETRGDTDMEGGSLPPHNLSPPPQ
ncbi:hypothetical protein AXF42_Ash000804 [Apostasia shenzhenica]|uniref:Uncharacterized protein n=1 Tax=Apostasia shenzhenica TaxID=1088818 RepID=A0A2I0AT33_9ASPA|nr:hypothetical protein AXF42_Ash000804 [Apostasia shenzhenica]